MCRREGWDKANEIQWLCAQCGARTSGPGSRERRRNVGRCTSSDGRSMGPDAAGYTSSYTSWGDPTHPLDPRKIFSRSFWPSILFAEQTVRYSFDVQGFNLGDYGVLVSRSPFPSLCLLPTDFSLFFSLSLSHSFSQSALSESHSLRSLSDGLSYPLVVKDTILGRGAGAVGSFYRDASRNRPSLRSRGLIWYN